MTAIFPLAVWQPGTLQPSTPVNDNALRVEVLQRGATSILSTPPISPADGQLHIVGASPTGAWSTFAQNDVVIWRSGTWYRFAPFTGWLKQVGTEVRRFDGSAWVVVTGGGGGGAVPVQDEGSVVVAAPTAINFVGSGVTTTNVGGVATVNIPGGGGGGAGFYGTFLAPNQGSGIAFPDDTFLRVQREAAGEQMARLNQFRSAGKHYFEFLVSAIGSGVCTFGIAQSAANTNEGVGVTAATTSRSASWGVLSSSGNKYHGSVSSYGSSITTSDVIMVAVDFNTSSVWMGKNGTWFASGNPAANTGAAFTNLVGLIAPAVSLGGNAIIVCRTKLGDFSYSPPSGFSQWAA